MTETIQTDIVTKFVGFEVTAFRDGVFVMSTGSLTSTGTVAILSNHDRTGLILDGDVRSRVTTAIALNGFGDDVQIRSTATVSSAGLASYGGCLTMSGAGGNLYNGGTIMTPTGGAVIMSGFGSTMLNVGQVLGDTFGVKFDATAATLTNYGMILCQNGDFWAGAVSLVYSDVTLVNYGTIQAAGAEAAGIRSGGLVANPATGGIDGVVISNTGTITSAGGWGIQFIETSAGASLNHVENSGVISGALGAVLGNNGSDSVTNSGMMTGDVRLMDGNDVYDGLGGTVVGQIAGGMGDDLYRITDAAAQIVELAGQGYDRIEAAVSFDMTATLNIERLTLLGFDALDATGNEQSNLILGNAGANHIFGAGGADRLVGLFGSDVLEGGAGSDLLVGGGGRDSLHGGEGDDRINGGFGADIMTGGAGADAFVFWGAAESAGRNTDTITDFTSGLDRINVAAIDADQGLAGDQAFNFIGGATFGGVAGQARYAGGILALDIDGDGIADMQIILTGAPVLVAGDLSL